MSTKFRGAFSEYCKHYHNILLTSLVNNKNKEKNNLEDPVLFCDGCFALASELHKDLSSSAGAGLKLRERVEASLAAVCSTDRLRCRR